MVKEVPQITPGERLTDVVEPDPGPSDQVVIDSPAMLIYELVEASNSPTVILDPS